MGEACGMYGKKRNALRVLVGNAEGKRPTGRYKHRWILKQYGLETPGTG
jgi:hypothetical protein